MSFFDTTKRYIMYPVAKAKEWWNAGTFVKKVGAILLVLAYIYAWIFIIRALLGLLLRRGR